MEDISVLKFAALVRYHGGRKDEVQENVATRGKAGGQDNNWEQLIGDERRGGKEGFWGNTDQSQRASKGHLQRAVCASEEEADFPKSWFPTSTPDLFPGFTVSVLSDWEGRYVQCVCCR